MRTIKKWVHDFKYLPEWRQILIILLTILDISIGLITIISFFTPSTNQINANNNTGNLFVNIFSIFINSPITQNQNNGPNNSEPLKEPNITIEKFESRQKIYKIGDIAHVDFTINNTLNVPYNFKLYWISNYETLEGWSAISTDIYPIDTKVNAWGSYFPDLDSNGLLWKGNWTVNLTVNYDCQDEVCFGSRSQVTKFNVTKNN